MTDDEAAAALSSVFILQFRLRPLAKKEKSEGVVDVLEFDVRHAWSLIDCTGEGCCPNTWLIETTEGDFVYAEHRELLQQERGCFPGSHVCLHRYPHSKRIIKAELSGVPVKMSELPVELWKVTMAIHQPAWWECEVLAESPFPAAMEM